MASDSIFALLKRNGHKNESAATRISKHKGGKRARPEILCVDENSEGLAVLREYLAARGFEVLTATSGIGGLLAAQECLPDIVITANAMLGISGVELGQYLRVQSATERTRIVVYSEVPIETPLRGCDRVLVKPFTLEAVLGAISELLESA